MKYLLIALTSVIILLAGCNGDSPATTGPTTYLVPGTEVSTPNGSYWRITPAQLVAMRRAEFFLVCVDEQPSMIIGGTSTDTFVKYSEINQNLDRFPADKNRRVVVYCIAGVTSQSAAEALVTAGYTQVMHLDGGTMNWQNQGYPAAMYNP